MNAQQLELVDQTDHLFAIECLSADDAFSVIFLGLQDDDVFVFLPEIAVLRDFDVDRLSIAAVILPGGKIAVPLSTSSGAAPRPIKKPELGRAGHLAAPLKSMAALSATASALMVLNSVAFAMVHSCHAKKGEGASFYEFALQPEVPKNRQPAARARQKSRTAQFYSRWRI